MNLDTCPHSREATVTGLTGGVEQTGATRLDATHLNTRLELEARP